MPDELEKLLRDFGKAFFNADAESLAECITSDFEWHQHVGTNAPTGNVIKGADATCEEVKRRKQEWRDVKYADFQNHFTKDLIVSTFTVSGIDEKGQSFNVCAVDLYPIANGKILLKDSYWKRIY